jgi:hypothetical protein
MICNKATNLKFAMKCKAEIFECFHVLLFLLKTCKINKINRVIPLYHESYSKSYIKLLIKGTVERLNVSSR